MMEKGQAAFHDGGISFLRYHRTGELVLLKSSNSTRAMLVRPYVPNYVLLESWKSVR